MFRLFVALSVVLVWTTAEPIPLLNGNYVTCTVCKEAVKIVVPLLEQASTRIAEEFVAKCKEFFKSLPFAEYQCKAFADQQLAQLKAALAQGYSPDVVCQKIKAC
ncbi:surfactant protein B [Ostertagia ostertagi]